MFTLVGLFFLLVRMYGLLNLFVLMKLCCDGDSDWNQFSIVDLATASSCVLWTEEDVRIVCNYSQHWKDEFNLILNWCLLVATFFNTPLRSKTEYSLNSNFAHIEMYFVSSIICQCCDYIVYYILLKASMKWEQDCNVICLFQEFCTSFFCGMRDIYDIAKKNAKKNI